MFTYCLNNPTNNYDEDGLWTMGISLGGNITVFLGVSISIGIYWDGEGNFDWQWSYSVPGVDDTMTIGIIGAGVGLAFQQTDRETVYDLYGSATATGASGGALWYIGGDMISFADASDRSGTINGYQVAGGIGMGLDVHLAETNTKPIASIGSSKPVRLSNRQKRINFCSRINEK